MQFKRILGLAALLSVVFLGSGCRAIQINKMEERIDMLENRVTALEAQVGMLTRK